MLVAYFRDQPGTLVSGGGYIRLNRHSPRTEWPVPDCLVALDVVDPQSIVNSNGYDISEIGKPPDFVLEIASWSTGINDYTTKRDLYAKLKVLEYWRFDWTGGRYHDMALAGDRLVNGVYVPIDLTTDADGIVRGHSAVLGLDLCWDHGELRFYDPVAGEYLRDHVESETERIAAEERADALERENRRLREQIMRSGES